MKRQDEIENCQITAQLLKPREIDSYDSSTPILSRLVRLFAASHSRRHASILAQKYLLYSYKSTCAYEVHARASPPPQERDTTPQWCL
jgi:hypothetical protein